MSNGEHRHCCVTFKIQGFVWEKKSIVSVTYENERISIKNSLPSLKCVLCLSWPTGRFITVLWVLCKRFSLYKKVYQGWAFQRSGSTDSLQLLQSPPNSSQVTHDSSSFHSLSCFKTPLHRERIKGRKSLQPFPV